MIRRPILAVIPFWIPFIYSINTYKGNIQTHVPFFCDLGLFRPFSLDLLRFSDLQPQIIQLWNISISIFISNLGVCTKNKSNFKSPD